MDTSKVVTSNKRRKIEVDPDAPLPDASEFIREFKCVLLTTCARRAGR